MFRDVKEHTATFTSRKDSDGNGPKSRRDVKEMRSLFTSRNR